MELKLHTEILDSLYWLVKDRYLIYGIRRKMSNYGKMAYVL